MSAGPAAAHRNCSCRRRAQKYFPISRQARRHRPGLARWLAGGRERGQGLTEAGLLGGGQEAHGPRALKPLGGVEGIRGPWGNEALNLTPCD